MNPLAISADNAQLKKILGIINNRRIRGLTDKQSRCRVIFESVRKIAYRQREST